MARDAKVIGYFAYMSAAEVVCTDVDAFPLAREAGFPVEWGNFEEAKKRNDRFFTVRLSWVQ